MTRTKKIIAILSVITLLGVAIYRVNANDGYEASAVDAIVNVDEGMMENYDTGEECALGEASVVDAPELGADILDYPQGESYFPEYPQEGDNIGLEEQELGDDIDECLLGEDIDEGLDGEFQAIVPAFGRPDALTLTVLCFYTNVQLTRNVEVAVTWDPIYPDTTPGLFTVSFPAEIIPVVPSGWNLEGAYIRFYVRDPDGNGSTAYFEPFGIVGSIASFTFPFNFDSWGAWHQLPVFEILWRPEHPPIVKDSRPLPPATLPVFVGDIIEYTITIDNPAVNPLLLLDELPPWRLTTFDGFRVVDDLPNEISLIPGSVSVQGGTGVVDNSNIDNSVIDVTFNLPGANENSNPVVITFHALVTTEAFSVDQIINTAYLYNPNTDFPIFDREVIPVGNPPTLVKDIVYINDNPFTGQGVGDGNIITYRLRVNNPNDRTLQNHLVRDDLPPGLSLVGTPWTVPETALVQNQSVGNTLQVILDLSSGNTDIFFTARVDDAMQAVDGIFVNIAYLYGPPAEGGERPQLDQDRAQVGILPPDVSIEKSASDEEAGPGDDLTYTIVVTNTGGIRLTNLVVTDDLPEELTSPRNLVITPAGAGSGRFDGQVLTVNIPSLLAGESVTITFVATVADNVPIDTVIHNTATVTTDQNVTDDDDATVIVVETPRVSIVKSVPNRWVTPGGHVPYTIVVRNTGNVQLTNLEVIDNLPLLLTNPRNLRITPEEAGTGSFVGQRLTVNIPVLEIADYVTITFLVTIYEGVDYGTSIRNVATVTTDQNVGDEDEVTVTVPGGGGDDPERAPLTGDMGASTPFVIAFLVSLLALIAISTQESLNKTRKSKRY